MNFQNTYVPFYINHEDIVQCIRLIVQSKNKKNNFQQGFSLNTKKHEIAKILINIKCYKQFKGSRINFRFI